MFILAGVGGAMNSMLGGVKYWLGKKMKSESLTLEGKFLDFGCLSIIGHKSRLKKNPGLLPEFKIKTFIFRQIDI